MISLGLAGAWTAGTLKHFLESSVGHEIQRKATENADSLYSMAIPVYDWMGRNLFTGSLEKVADNIGTGLAIVGLGYIVNESVKYGKRQIKNTIKYF